MSNHGQAWLVQQLVGDGVLDFVDLYGSREDAISKALEEVVRAEERIGLPEETHAERNTYHRWHWPGLYTVIIIQTTVQ